MLAALFPDAEVHTKLEISIKPWKVSAVASIVTGVPAAVKVELLNVILIFAPAKILPVELLSNDLRS